MGASGQACGACNTYRHGAGPWRGGRLVVCSSLPSGGLQMETPQDPQWDQAALGAENARISIKSEGI
jgi:hypothetical protein